MSRVGFEPTANGLKVRCSAWLSYRLGVLIILHTGAGGQRKDDTPVHYGVGEAWLGPLDR